MKVLLSKKHGHRVAVNDKGYYEYSSKAVLSEDEVYEDDIVPFMCSVVDTAGKVVVAEVYTKEEEALMLQIRNQYVRRNPDANYEDLASELTRHLGIKKFTIY